MYYLTITEIVHMYTCEIVLFC